MHQVDDGALVYRAVCWVVIAVLHKDVDMLKVFLAFELQNTCALRFCSLRWEMHLACTSPTTKGLQLYLCLEAPVRIQRLHSTIRIE